MNHIQQSFRVWLCNVRLIRDLHAEGLNYRQIANRLNASYDAVKSIGEGLYGTYHYFSANPKKGGAIKSDWNAIDAATLPMVKEAICKLQGDGASRPVKISIGTIERYLKLPKNGLRNYPICRAEIQRYTETQEQYWARELIWAAQTIIDNRQSLHLTAIKKLTNMRSAYVTACLPYLDMNGDSDTVARIYEIL